jgi:DNA ligase (NAD+)
LWDLGLVRSVPDLYRLTKEQLLELDGFQDKSASNVVDSIARSKEIPFHRVLFGLNIPDVGWVTAQTLARHFGSVDALARASQEEIQEVEGMGPLRAESIAGWFSEQDNLRLVEELRELGLNLESGDELKPVEGPLTGNTYVITGTLESMTREEAAAELEARGAKIAGSVSKKTSAVVVGEDPGGTKFNKAKELGTPLLDENAFKELLASSAVPDGRPRVSSAPPTRFGR